MLSLAFNSLQRGNLNIMGRLPYKCAVRLCEPDQVVHDGCVELSPKKNKPAEFDWGLVKACGQCGRVVFKTYGIGETRSIVDRRSTARG